MSQKHVKKLGYTRVSDFSQSQLPKQVSYLGIGMIDFNFPARTAGVIIRQRRHHNYFHQSSSGHWDRQARSSS